MLFGMVNRTCTSICDVGDIDRRRHLLLCRKSRLEDDSAFEELADGSSCGGIFDPFSIEYSERYLLEKINLKSCVQSYLTRAGGPTWTVHVMDMEKIVGGQGERQRHGQDIGDLGLSHRNQTLSAQPESSSEG